MLALLQSSTKLSDGFPRGCWLNILDFLEKVIDGFNFLNIVYLINSNPSTKHILLHFYISFQFVV